MHATNERPSGPADVRSGDAAALYTGLICPRCGNDRIGIARGVDIQPHGEVSEYEVNRCLNCNHRFEDEEA